MKKKLSILLVIALMIFAFVPALTLAQEETVVEEDLVEDEEMDQISDELKEVLEGDYDSVEEFLTALEENELLSTVEKITLEKKLSSYEENLNIDSITSVVDKVLTEEIDLGQGFVILNNLAQSVSNGFDEESALKMINNYQDQEHSGQLAFQTALELRKMNREDNSGEKSAAFADEVASIIEKNGEIEISELKQLAAEYRKEAREENREQMRADRSEISDSASENALEKGKANNASEQAMNKENNGTDKSNGSKAEDKADNKDSNKSSNSNAGEHTKK